MTWLTPLGFLGLIGLIVLIIIYIIKPNYQQKFISSTFVWKLSLKYRKKKIPINQLRNILIFICQVLIITSCALILAQPIIAGEDADENKEQIVIIDASASMRTETAGETRFERAVDEAQKIADEAISKGTSVTIILAADEASDLVQRAGADFSSEIKTKLDELIDPKDFACTWGNADIDGAIELAEDIVMINPNCEIKLLTGSSYIDAGKVSVIDVSDISEWNAAILDVRAIIDENYYRFEVDVACYGKDASFDVSLDINGINDLFSEYELSQNVHCTNNEITTAVFDVAHLADNDLAGIYAFDSAHAYVNVADNLIKDNDFYLYGGLKQPLKVQYYSIIPNNFYSGVLMGLREATKGYWDFEIKEIRDSLQNLQYGKQKEYALEGYDIYIFEHYMPPTMPTDGLVILANPDNVPAGADFTLSQYYTSGTAEQPLSKEEHHTLLENMTVEDITVTRWAEIPMYDSYDALMWCNGMPVVLSKNTDTEKILVLGLNLNYSNFAITEQFPIFFYNALKYYFPETISKNNFEINESIALNARSTILEVSGPDNLQLNIKEFPNSIELDTPGTYTLYQTPISGRDVLEKFYVHIPSAASNTEAVYDELTNPYFPPVEEAPDIDLVFYFALALVCLLFAEWWLQSREQF